MSATRARDKGPAEAGKMRIVQTATEKLRPPARAARTHSEAQIEQIAASIRRFGFTVPVLVGRKGVVLAGWGRVVAARKLGLPKVPCIELAGMTPAEQRAYVLADNRIAQNAGWDEQLLALELRDLQEAGFDLEALGFKRSEAGSLIDGLVSAAEMAAPALPVEVPARVKAGELWLLGEHRLICGDCRRRDLLERLFGADRAHMVFTDPPFGVDYQSQHLGGYPEDEPAGAGLCELLGPAFALAVEYARDDAGFYIWHSTSTRHQYLQAMTAAGLVERNYLIWIKEGATKAFGGYDYAYEPCFYAAKADHAPKFCARAGRSMVWRIRAISSDGGAAVIGSGLVLEAVSGARLFVRGAPPRTKRLRTIAVRDGHTVNLADRGDAADVWEVRRDPVGDYMHPTQKPVELAAIAVKNSSRRGEIVYDGFGGSGSTLLACEQLGRRCRMVELEPRFCDVILYRWEEMSGGKATREGEKCAAGAAGGSRRRARSSA